MHLLWKKINTNAIVVSLVLLVINFIFGDRNAETFSLVEQLTESLGLLIFVANVFIAGPIIFLILSIKHQLAARIFLINLGLMTAHMVISLYFVLNMIGRASF